jgi:beta-lactam-binding protein with PASTA domain
MDLRSVFNFKRLDQLDPRHYRALIAVLISLVVLMGFSGVIAFFFTLRGEEQTLVPNVVDMELSAALVKLQEKELYPRVSLRFSSDPETRGRILEQEPLPGAIVKAGRRIALVVSRGAAQDKVGDYVGQTVDEVKIHLQTVFGSLLPSRNLRSISTTPAPPGRYSNSRRRPTSTCPAPPN